MNELPLLRDLSNIMLGIIVLIIGGFAGFAYLYATFNLIIERQKLMATSADLDLVLSKIEDKITSLGSDLQKTLADLAAKIAAGSTGPDLQPEVDRANAIADKLATFDTEATTADPGDGSTPPVAS